MAIWCLCFCGMQWRAIGQLCGIPFSTLFTLFSRWTRLGLWRRLLDRVPADPPDVRHALLRVVQSAASNIKLHAGAATATLTRSVAETVSVRADPSPPERTALPEQLVLSKDRYGR